MNKERSDMDIETVKQKIEDSQRSENLLVLECLARSSVEMQ